MISRLLPTARPWFERSNVGDDITLILEPHVAALLRCNIWHVRGRDRDLMIDTGMGVASLTAFARDLLDRPVSAVATHAHLDHIGGLHEFDHVIAHAAEARGIEAADPNVTLAGRNFDPNNLATLGLPPIEDCPIEGPMLTALPHERYDVTSYAIRPTRIGRLVLDGDLIDLGDRVFEVLHLPGHSPGGIGLWEARSQTLFSGDAIYDGPLLANLPGSDLADYAATLRRLQKLPVRIVHAGHDPSFGRDRLNEIVESYLRRWGG